MNGRGIASFMAGMGAGYFNAEEKKKDRERQAAKDKMEKDRFDLEMERMKKQDAKDEALTTGMREASAMKVGQLRDENGAVDTSAGGFEKRLLDNGVDAAVAEGTAQIYAARAKDKGSEEWLKGSFGNPAQGGIGQAQPTTRGDIRRKQAEVLTSGGKYDQAINMQDQADKFDSDDMQTKILAAKDFDEIDKLYDIVPDGMKVKSSVDEKDGRFRYWYEDAEGKRINPSQNLPQDFADFNEFKTFAAAYVKQNPEYITSAWDKAHGRKREGAIDQRAEEKHSVDMEAGKLGIEGATSDLKVKKATEGDRIAGAGLDNQSKRASIANVYDAIAARKQESIGKSTESQQKLNEEKRKNGDQFRQDVNASVSVFDKSFKRDAMGNLMGNELDSKLYSQAVKVIGSEIKRGASIDDAQAIGRLVYDEAKSGGVSVDTAYNVMRKKMETGNKPSGKAATGGGGAAAVDAYLSK